MVEELDRQGHDDVYDDMGLVDKSVMTLLMDPLFRS